MAQRNRFMPLIEIKDKDDVVREIPSENFQDTGFRLYGMTLSQILMLRNYYVEREGGLPE